MLHICFLQLHLVIGNILPSHRVHVVHKEKIPLTTDTEQQTTSLLNNFQESTITGDLSKPTRGINESTVLRNVQPFQNVTDVSWPAARWLPKAFLSAESQAPNIVYEETIKRMTFPFRRSQTKHSPGEIFRIFLACVLAFGVT